MFRKIVTWYTKALRFPKKVQQKLVMLNDLTEFESILAPFVDNGPPPDWSEWDVEQSQVAVPAGPIAHW